MRSRMICAVAALFIIGAPLANAQQNAPSGGATSDKGRISPTEFKMLTDIRVGLIKVALQLNPEQEKRWPAVEEAIRARAEARFGRLNTLAERLNKPVEVDPVQLYRQRASVLADRAAGLRKLADAWQPLYDSLSAEQKTRLGLVTVKAIERLRTAMENRQMDFDDEEDADLLGFVH